MKSTVYFRMGESEFRAGAAYPAHPVNKTLVKGNNSIMKCFYICLTADALIIKSRGRQIRNSVDETFSVLSCCAKGIQSKFVL